ncbi:MAG TPA: 3'-5' exonuclease [Gemmataceae bacterium]|nr:3'-5' exonuclease [Gemmataceae bacterium]
MGNSDPTRPAFLVVDTESIPDGELLAKVKYAAENVSPADAIARAQEEARQASKTGSDFVNVAFQIPVAVCVVKVGNDFSLQAITCLDAPLFRPKEIVRKFWLGVGMYEKAKLVTFNGRGFDMPMLELAAFRQGLSLRDYCQKSRNRFQGNHLDLCDWLNNFGACRFMGGLNLFAKMIGKPGKMDIAGDQVHRMHCDGRFQEINDYCLFDTLDTYFVFLRTRVLTGDIALEQEQELVQAGREYLHAKVGEFPALGHYVRSWEA